MYKTMTNCSPNGINAEREGKQRHKSQRQIVKKDIIENNQGSMKLCCQGYSYTKKISTTGSIQKVWDLLSTLSK